MPVKLYTMTFKIRYIKKMQNKCFLFKFVGRGMRFKVSTKNKQNGNAFPTNSQTSNFEKKSDKIIVLIIPSRCLKF